MSEQTRHPIQPLVKDERGTLRFKANAIVCYLLDLAPTDLNHLAGCEFSTEDREQFAQLIGYSLSGFSELSYVTNDTLGAAVMMADKGLPEVDARVVALEATIAEIREGLRTAATSAFRIHPDDLQP